MRLVINLNGFLLRRALLSHLAHLVPALLHCVCDILPVVPVRIHSTHCAHSHETAGAEANLVAQGDCDRVISNFDRACNCGQRFRERIPPNWHHFDHLNIHLLGVPPLARPYRRKLTHDNLLRASYYTSSSFCLWRRTICANS